MAIRAEWLGAWAILAVSIAIPALHLSAGQASKVGSTPAFLPNGYVCEGDSHTTGDKDFLGYPTYLARLTGLGVTNVATSGDTLERIDAAYSTNVAPAFNADHRNTLIVIAGDEDFIKGRTVAQVQASIQSIAAKASATGFHVVVAPVMAVGTANWTGAMEARRQAYNAWLRMNWHTFADAITDHAADERLSDPGNTTYFQADRMHLTPAGYIIMAEYAKAASNGPTPRGVSAVP